MQKVDFKLWLSFEIIPVDSRARKPLRRVEVCRLCAVVDVRQREISERASVELSSTLKKTKERRKYLSIVDNARAACYSSSPQLSSTYLCFPFQLESIRLLRSLFGL